MTSIFTAVADALSFAEARDAVTVMSFSDTLLVTASYFIANDAPPCGGMYAVYGNVIVLPPFRLNLPMFCSEI